MPLSRAWITSSYSGSEGGNCVQARATGHRSVQVRDSKNPTGPVLTFTTATWNTLITAIKNGHHHT